jgi:uncharacterized protein
MKRKITIYNAVIAVILVLILVIGSLIVFVNPNPKRVQKTVDPMNTESVEASKPVFRKDGELRFLKSKDNTIISTLNIEVADDDAERAQGLMYREAMNENDGMLFLMGAEEIQNFWMKNTILPLDILYVNSERRIVSIHANCKPYSLENINSDKPAQYVVEVNAGYAEKHGIKIGDLISF